MVRYFFQTKFLPLPGATCQGEPEDRMMDGKGSSGKFPLARSRAPERLPKRGFALFEAKPSLQSPGSIEEHRDSRQRRDKGHGCPFLVSSFGHAKEEKGTTKKGGRSFPPSPRASQHIRNSQPAAINLSISSLPMVSFSNKSLAMASMMGRFSVSSRVAVSLASVTSPVTAWSILTAVSPL